MQQAIFKLDDSDEPGLAKVNILGRTTKRFKGRDVELVNVEVVEVVRPSFRKIKVGQRLAINAGLLA